ncbi:hypothetical protein DRQ50_14120 [bacterium]|nr:MAG: hypothetical protein DRQ50_14120 [bacterium]
MQEISPYNRAVLREKGLDKAAVKAGIQKLREKAEVGAIYLELQMVHKEVDFKPTVAQINKALKAVGIEKELPSVAGKAITQYMVELDKSGLSNITSDQQQYLDLMTACAGSPMKDRTGDDYEKFREVSADLLKFDAEPVTVGTELNFGSPNQMQHFLYVMLGLPIRRHTKVTRGSKRDELGHGGGPATNEAAIQLAIAEDCTGADAWKGDVLRNLIVYTKCDTREKLYWKPYPLWKHPIDGMMHPQINQSATVTHRPTGSSPNLLQVSKKDGGRTRSVFIGGQTEKGEDYVYISVDFSGQELRIIASETKDPVMLDAYIGENKKDLHTVTACAIGKSYIEKTAPDFDLGSLVWDGEYIDYAFFDHIRKEEPINEQVLVKLLKLVRGAGKELNFGVAYGAGPTTIAMGLFIPVEVARVLMESLFARYVRLPIWKEEVWDFAEKHGYVETVYGPRRHCWPDIISSDTGTKSRMQRQVANFVIQGTAADILKVVMTAAKHEGIFLDTGAILLAPIYDQLAARVPTSIAVEYITRISACMSVTPPGHQVPMVPEASIGLNWGMQKELGAYPSEDKILKALEDLYADV